MVNAGRLTPARFEPARPVIDIRLADLRFGIHDEGALCHDRLTTRAAREDQNA